MNLVTKSAIDFTAPAVLPDGEIVDNFCLSEHIKGKYAVLLFYPLDFTFVCPTELISLNNRISEFAKRDIEVMGISVDSKFSHYQWRKTSVSDGGIGEISYTLVSDIKKSISRNYGVLYDDSVALRATFVIDDKFIVRHQSTNDLPLGRNIDEFIRIVDAIKHNEEYGEVCPAGWKKGKPAMQASDEGVADYLNSYSEEL
ncbi:redoxin domain-containing protein [Wolbachia endosymbiont of Litomosoides brasiliensis]|uniref:peroxiredoxin n=1 Tax=Wolbachia endosymbiont of Litomosoides brasiliensis TaxID=1812117 RepID=UPI00158A6DE7|nr:peroxiredoxin [Wolbachia endosymbiont of Litomosoides brasiliensis]NUY39635.1 redoxin domain-containing protein [Wolbachia endosymbiont of Litomosoides brasiliensis]